MEEAYTKIDLEFGDDTSTPLPDNLTKKVCEDLLREKQQYLKSAMIQF